MPKSKYRVVSLRTLVIGLPIVVGLLLIMVRHEAAESFRIGPQNEIKRRAIASLEASGFKVESWSPSIPYLRHTLFGAPPSIQIVSVQLDPAAPFKRGKRPFPRSAECLSALRAIEDPYMLAVSGSDFSCRDLRSLSSARFSILTARSTELKDCDLTGLQYPKLEILDVSDTEVGDRFAATVDSFPSLKDLNIRRTKVTLQAYQDLEARAGNRIQSHAASLPQSDDK